MPYMDTAFTSSTLLVITCEHGGNKVPAPYSDLFRDNRALLESHRGYDIGALIMAKAMASHFGVPLMTSLVSRLVVDLNRSIGHKDLHGHTVRSLPVKVRNEIIERYHQPYWTDATHLVERGITRHGKVVHVSCHSFTNTLNGITRKADIGLLYDPARLEEKALCAHWKSALEAANPKLVVRRNFPYEGRHDGLTSALRKKFPPDTYLGIELEMNQKYLRRPAIQWTDLRTLVINSLNAALSHHIRTIGSEMDQHTAGASV
jgi:predicted N-formylglutamate amidohydrolase